MRSRILSVFTFAFFVLCGTAFGQFLPNLPQFNNGADIGAFLQADVNNDGVADIIAMKQTTAPKPNFELVVMLGNGTGGFAAPVVTSITAINALPGGLGFYPFEIGDFNGDGKIDAAVFGTNPVTNQFSVALLLGNGNGTFEAAKVSPIVASEALSSNTCSYITGDFNGDGKLDLFLPTSSGIYVLPGKGDGTFSAAVFTADSNFGSFCFAAGDFNGDKKLDLAASAGEAFVLLGNGDGTFQTPTLVGFAGGTVQVADVNGDGNLDLITSGGSVLLGNGAGKFPTVNTFTTNGFGSFAIVDLNGDGHPDIVQYNTSINTYINSGSGTFTPGKSYAGDGIGSNAGLLGGDLNKNGKPDLAFPNSLSGITVLTGNGHGTFNGNMAVNGFIQTPKVAVFNPGGKTDILSTGFNNTSQIMLGNSDGTFTVVHTGCVVDNAAVGDFNHDGKIDYAGMIPGQNPFVEVCLSNGDGTFTSTGEQFDTGVSHSLLLAGDFNGDGRLDLFGADTGGFSILLGNGDGTFQNGITTAATPSKVVALSDFNHDGKLDIAIISGTPGEVVASVYLGNGDGTFKAPITSPAAGGLYVAATDLNGDGNPDLAITGDTDVIVMLGKGNGTFQAPVRYAINANTRPAIADFNLDGHPDIAVASTSTSQVYILFNDGTGKFPTQAQFHASGVTSDGLATGDFNGDHKPDLAINTTFPVNGPGIEVEVMLHQ